MAFDSTLARGDLNDTFRFGKMAWITHNLWTKGR
jgi:hypothetical protein